MSNVTYNRYSQIHGNIFNGYNSAKQALDTIVQEVWVNGQYNPASVAEFAFAADNFKYEAPEIKADIYNMNLGIIDSIAHINSLIDYKNQNGANALDEQHFVDFNKEKFANAVDVINESKARISSRNNRGIPNIQILMKGMSALQALFTPDKNASDQDKYNRILQIYTSLGVDINNPEIRDSIDAVTMLFGDRNHSVISLLTSLFNMSQMADTFLSIANRNKTKGDVALEMTTAMASYVDAFNEVLNLPDFDLPGVHGFADQVETAALKKLANAGLILQNPEIYKKLNGNTYMYMSSNPWLKRNQQITNVPYNNDYMMVTGPNGVQTINNGVVNNNPTPTNLGYNNRYNNGGNNMQYNNNNNPFVALGNNNNMNRGVNNNYGYTQPNYNQNVGTVPIAGHWTGAPNNVQPNSYQQPMNLGVQPQPNNGFQNNNYYQTNGFQQAGFQNNGFVNPNMNTGYVNPNVYAQPQPTTFVAATDSRILYGMNSDGSSYRPGVTNNGMGGVVGSPINSYTTPMNNGYAVNNGYNMNPGVITTAPYNSSNVYNINSFMGAEPINFGTSGSTNTNTYGDAVVGGMSWYVK